MTTKTAVLKALQCRTLASQSVLLSGRGLCAEVSVLAADLFRLRVARGKKLPPSQSWAVLKNDWSSTPVTIKTHRQILRVGTGRGTLSLNLEDGRWELRDHYGLALFSADPCATGFSKEKAQVILHLQDEESIFGLGESSGPFDKRGLIRDFWNIDVGGHASTVHAGLRNMYVSIPLAISLRHGRAAGLLWDNPGRQSWDIGQTDSQRWKLSAASGEIDLYLFLGPACPEILERYTELTGRMPLPPEWSLGYQQCRYSYETRPRLEAIARTFRAKKIPCDTLYLDIHYMDGYRVFTFGKSFPNPRQMVARLAQTGFKVVTIVDPGVKDHPAFQILQRGREERAFVKARDGESDYRGRVWPGPVRFPDFLRSRTRTWWGEEQSRFQRLGIAGFWNDMNEPADFSSPDKDFPGDCLHRTDFGDRRHAEIHNAYGSQMARASYEGALRHAPDQRPFIITRAGYAGVQRFAAIWTGDNDSNWEHLADSIPMLLNLSLSGVPFCGADVGGFHDNTTGELLARWTQLAAFTPFFRNHSNIGTIPQEPWAFGPQIEAICRRYIGLRYQLLPYFYSLFAEASRRGTPIIRPLFWHYQNDPRAVAASDQFMLGRDLLIAPIVRPKAIARSVYLPAGIWFDFWSGQAFRGGQPILAEVDLETMPIFVRAGALLPMIGLQQYVGQRKTELVNLHVWPGTEGALDWYEDDGTSLGYQRGQYLQRTLTVTLRKKTTHLHFAAAAGSYPGRIKNWRLLLRNASRPARLKAAGREMKGGFHPELALCAFEISNQPGEFEVEWR